MPHFPRLHTTDTLTNPFIICNVYRPARSTIPVLREFLNELAPVVNSLDMLNHNVILAGDFKINLLKVNENLLYGEFLDLLMSHSLNPQITLPTRFSTNNGTLIDNIFSKLFNPSASTCAGIHMCIHIQLCMCMSAACIHTVLELRILATYLALHSVLLSQTCPCMLEDYVEMCASASTCDFLAF